MIAHERVACARTLAVAWAAISILTTASAGFTQVQPGDALIAEESSDAVSQSDSTRRKSPPPDIHGLWCGSARDIEFGQGKIIINIVQRGRKLTGTWSADWAGDGTFRGSLKGNTVNLRLKQKGSACRAAATGSLVSPQEIVGDYRIFGCHESDGATIVLANSDC